MIDFDVVIIGAGVVGLACGAHLSDQGLSVVVLEAEKTVASVTSARNSEVIHAGFYYEKNSLKHLLCLRGRRLLYQFAAHNHIAHKKCGKLVVATTLDELEKIENLAMRATDNGVENVSLLTAAQVHELEPQLTSVGGLFSGETGIIDAHGLCQSLVRIIEENGAIIALNTPFLRADIKNYGFDIKIGGIEPATLRARYLINSAGLNATYVAKHIEGLESQFCHELIYAKGSYFSLSGKAPFSRLVYPAPVEGGLGIHATLDLAGRIRFGPDVEWLEQFRKSGNRFCDKNCGKTQELEHLPDCPSEGKNALERFEKSVTWNWETALEEVPEFDYRVKEQRVVDFYRAIRRYWPHLADNSLHADYAGIRPKVSSRSQVGVDFLIETQRTHGVSGLVNLFGVESPGLTASLALGEKVALEIYDN